MITLPIWLFILCVILGFPLLVIILTIIGHIIYVSFKISEEIFKDYRGEL